ncbi:hypothetical protein QJS04_geneDACA017286 [Acorus gramineus]|uniref:Integrator complex subunit 3 N-terminal domain-containing protein n=1 Tax=Acorus gramineus TaxID=55184 RepID=A0AAV9A2X0_ACOGR|nr:hypothetical protein QJS04_geneDACA017286 [Acorus gramineus]
MLNLLRTSPHESRNHLEFSLRDSFDRLRSQLRPPFPTSVPSQSEYSDLNRAIVFGVLAEPDHLAKTHLTHLHSIVTDGYESFVDLLVRITCDSYFKLLDPARVRLLWVSSNMVDVSAVGVENLLFALLRCVVGGDFGRDNLWLAFELVRLFTAKWEWLLEERFVLSCALYTYLRLLADHYRLADPMLDELKRLEVGFCVRVLRHCFDSCLRIGRDLIRLLQDLVFIPEFGAIWKDLLANPSVFGVPEFSDISQLYKMRTSSRYFLLRLTPEMETQLRFLLTQVRWGCQKRYQIWFAKKFLNSPEKETLVCDFVRFICCAHHPSNEIIQSDVISRWAVVGWLLKCCRSNYVEANVKLGLFYDWLFFDERFDNIMNIEPAILLMVHSVPKYVDMTHMLLEFLFLLADNYDVARKDIIVRGISTSFAVLVKKGVIHSLKVLTSCDIISAVVRERLATFSQSSHLKIVREPLASLNNFIVPLNLTAPSS